MAAQKETTPEVTSVVQRAPDSLSQVKDVEQSRLECMLAGRAHP